LNGRFQDQAFSAGCVNARFEAEETKGVRNLLIWHHVAAVVITLGIVLSDATSVWAMDEGTGMTESRPKFQVDSPIVAVAKPYQFVTFKKHCTQCHNSVADPERPGKTRDEWYRIVNLMQSHGLDISEDEADIIVDLLFTLRRGIEDTPG